MDQSGEQNEQQQQQQQQLVASGSPSEAVPSSSQAGFAASQHQIAFQQAQQFHHQQQQQQHQQLQIFWANQLQEIEQINDFKNHSLPLARIKKIMKADEDVRMISSEAPVVFAKACEMFILELTLRSWIHTEENKRRTLQKNDIAAAITRTDIFDFLVDIVPRDDLKEEGLGLPRADSLPYYFVPPQHPPQVGVPGMLYPSQHPHAPVGYMPWPQPSQQQQQEQQQTDT